MRTSRVPLDPPPRAAYAVPRPPAAPWAHPRRIADLVRDAAGRDPDGEALVFDAERLSWAQLERRCDELCRGLVATGLVAGDRVALWMDNSVDWVVAYFALVRAGLVVVPVNTRLRPSEVAYVVEHSACRTAVVSSTVAGRPVTDLVRAVREEAPGHLGRLISRDPGIADDSFADLVEAGRGLSRRRYEDRVAAVHHEDLAILLYTSGTTGFPKAVMHSHEVIRNMTSLAERMGYGPEDRLLLYMPLFHVFANFAGVVAAAITGATVVLMASFDPRRSLELVQQERITVMFGVPTTYHDQLRVLREADFDLSSLRFCYGPGSPRDVRLVEDNFARSVNIYGMTETTSTTAVSLLEDDIALRSETVGRVLPGFEVRIVDEERRPVPADVVGQLAVRGHVVMQGYFRDPEATRRAVDADGWFYTGDLARLDDRDYLTFVGRSKDMIKVGGENVDPVEVETRILELPGVDQVSVVGVPDARLHEVVCAFIVLEPGCELDPADLVASLRPSMASFKLPRHVRVVEAFPLTATGKVQKARLKTAYAEETFNREDTPL